MVGQLKNGGSAEGFTENTKLELFNDQVFCFTRRRLIAMPRGATASGSYAVHAKLAIAVGARVSTASLPFRTLLKNGDEIEIVRGDEQLPAKIKLNHAYGQGRAAIAMLCASAKPMISLLGRK